MSSVSWQNALTICLILAILLTMFALATPAFADAPLVALPLLGDNERNTLLTDGLFIGSVGDYYYYSGTRIDSVYVGHVGRVVYLVSLNTDLGVIFSELYKNSTAGAPLSQVNMTLSQDGTYYYYSRTISGLSVDSGIPSYDSLESFVTAVKNYVPPVPYSSLNYSLPAGNIAFISVPSGATFDLHCYMPESVLGANHYPGNNQVVTLVNSLPSGGSAPSSPLIPWSQQGALSYLGLSRHAGYSSTTASAGYLCIVNPLYYSGTANGPYEFLSNGSIDISVDFANGITVYPLDSTLGFTSGLGIDVSTDILPGSFTGEINPDTGEIIWTDSEGGSSAPTTGGGNLVETGETIFDFLRHIADEIASFLRGPISAVKTVVAALRDFMTSFVQLYSWLPAPVYNLITAGLMIAVTIGVIKIFV